MLQVDEEDYQEDAAIDENDGELEVQAEVPGEQGEKEPGCQLHDGQTGGYAGEAVAAATAQPQVAEKGH